MDLIPALLQEITSADTLTLTANKRLSRWLLQQVRQANASPYFQAPRIMPFQTWLEQLWQTALLSGKTEPKQLLAPYQSQLVWHEIIQSHLDNPLLDTQGTAKAAEQAWRLCCDWLIDLQHPRFDLDDNGRQFKRWINAFHTRCQERTWLDPHALINTINQLIPSLDRLPKKILLLGFIELTPAQKQLITSLQKNGVAIEQPNHSLSETNTHRIACAQLDDEIEAMARWADQQIKQHPRKKIACIVPNLNQCRDKIDRAFRNIVKEQSRYNISSGTPLTKEPLIHTAFILLQMSKQIATIHAFSHILRSPFLAAGQRRAQCDTAIRETGKTFFHLNELLPFLEETDDVTLQTGIQQILSLDKKKKQKPSQWTTTILSLLQSFGWPGDRGLNSREYQTLAHFEENLKKLTTLDSFVIPITLNEAIQHLKTLCYNTLFQPQTADTPIQVLGLFETSGLLFDAIWVMGMDHQSWPSKPRPNPFIPIALQHELNIAHASADREFQFCEKITKQLLSQSHEVIISYATQSTESKLLPSPLIATLPLMTQPSHKAPHHNAITLETLKETDAPAVQEDENIRGGTFIFKSQAACPFQAFAKIRLKSESIAEPEIGLNAAEQGTLVHRALELFWKAMKTQKNLLAQSKEKLIAQLEKHIEQALSEQPSSHLPDFILRVEKKRLLHLLLRWLEIEKARPDFSVVAQEAWQTTKIDRLTIHMKADRLDKVGDNLFELIDYKTKKTSINYWFGNRPDEPQLPLYAISAKQPITAISFAQLKSNMMKFNRISHDSLPSHCDAEDWPALLNHWKKTMEQLAKEFSEGYAAVDPKDLNKSCRYCDLQGLCRVQELACDKLRSGELGK